MTALSGNAAPNADLLGFFELPRPNSEIGRRIMAGALPLLAHARGLKGTEAEELETLCDMLRRAEATPGTALTKRCQMLRRPTDKENFRYLLEPSLADVEAVASMPMLFVFDPAKPPDHARLAAAAKLPQETDTRRLTPRKPDGLLDPHFVTIADIEVPEGVDGETRKEIIKEVTGTAEPAPDGDIFLKCVIESFGIADIIALAFFLDSTIFRIQKSEKSNALGGGSKVSRFSVLMHKYLPYYIGVQIPTPTFKKIFSGSLSGLKSGSNHLGAIVARWVPGLGFLLLTYDVAKFAKCIHRSKNPPKLG